jgi:hypothetical protein
MAAGPGEPLHRLRPALHTEELDALDDAEIGDGKTRDERRNIKILGGPPAGYPFTRDDRDHLLVGRCRAREIESTVENVLG